jgi:5-methylthioadenosine/S-adenosylhomocysteine deaminase
MSALVPGLNASAGAEPLRVHGRDRLLNLAQATADPAVESVTVQSAIDRLTAAFANLPNSGQAPPAAPQVTRSLAAGAALLAASGVVNNHMSPRPHLPYRGKLTGPNLDDLRTTETTGRSKTAAAAAALPVLAFDPLTAVDNRAYYATLAEENKIPEASEQSSQQHDSPRHQEWSF